MDETIVGALIGAVATLLGVLFTYCFTIAAQAQKNRKELTGLLQALRAEIQSNLAIANQDGWRPFPTRGSTFEVLKARGFLGALSPEVAQEVIALYSLYEALNDSILWRRTIISAFGAGGRPAEKIPVELKGSDETLSGLKGKVISSSKRCLELLK